MPLRLATISAIAALLLSCATPTTPPLPKEDMVAILATLPSGCIYEESPESFPQTLSRGYYWQDEQNNTAYLFVRGDGTRGRRLFCMTPQRELSVIEHNTPEEEYEQETVSLYRYDGKSMNYVSTHPPEYLNALLPAAATEACAPEHLLRRPECALRAESATLQRFPFSDSAVFVLA